MAQRFREQALPDLTYGLSLNNRGLVGGYRIPLNEDGRRLFLPGDVVRTAIIYDSNTGNTVQPFIVGGSRVTSFSEVRAINDYGEGLVFYATGLTGWEPVHTGAIVLMPTRGAYIPVDLNLNSVIPTPTATYLHNQPRAASFSNLGWIVGNMLDRSFLWVMGPDSATTPGVPTGSITGLACTNFRNAIASTVNDDGIIGGSCGNKPTIWYFGLDADISYRLPETIRIYNFAPDPTRMDNQFISISRSEFLTARGAACSVKKITDNSRYLVNCTYPLAPIDKLPPFSSVAFLSEPGDSTTLTQFLPSDPRIDAIIASGTYSLSLVDVNSSGCVIGYLRGSSFHHCNGILDILSAETLYGINDRGQILLSRRDNKLFLASYLLNPINK